ncbi:MAG: OmpH family outer membrane protein [Bacteroidota bacterium]|nr:OmpH family outer membrane protein [Bacteroidota bacterium]
MTVIKKIILLLTFCLGISQLSNAQARLAFVDTEYILDKMPEYKSAQKQLDDQAEQWKKEIDNRVAEIDRLYKEYQAQYALLPEADRKKKEDEISSKEKSLSEFKKQKFGTDGELFKKRQQLIKPIQDKVFDAIQKLAKENSYDFVLDKAGAVTMLYTNGKYDRSDDVLELLGIVKK